MNRINVCADWGASVFPASLALYLYQPPNARGEPPLTAGATQERTLLAVGSSAMFGAA
jgi:hypothetical protein